MARHLIGAAADGDVIRFGKGSCEVVSRTSVAGCAGWNAEGRGVSQRMAGFYTGTIGSGAVAPVLYGLLGDAVGANRAMAASALTTLATLLLMLALAPRLTAH
nr:hypothetical protein [uncultured Rhodopila sp.]